MKFSKYLTAPAVALLMATGACDNGLTEVNRNPNEPEQVPPENLLASAIVSGIGGAYGTQGVWSGLYFTNLWSQQLAQPVYNTEDRYQLRGSQIEGIWNTMYTGPLPDLKNVKQIAQEEENPNLHAVGEILTQYLFHYLTDVYGDIPYSQALQAPEVTAPQYDPQAQVYVGILSSLEQAAGEIQTGATGSFADGDLIYGGDMAKWYRFANSLRMRVAMRMADADEATARQHFTAAYQAGGFQSNADNAMLVWGTSVPSQNPRYDQFYNQNRVDQLMSASVIDRLLATDDPRLAVYADPAIADGEYRGLPNGTDISQAGLTEPQVSWLGSYFLAPDAPSMLMTYSEVLFLQAEAAARGWIEGDAAQLYQEAIRASMRQYGIEESAIDAYLAQPEVAYDGLPSLYEQKWIALFMNGPEAWAEVRRTGYPELTPAVEDMQIPSRIPYPDQEEQYNPDNFRTTSLSDPMWWM